MFIVIELQTEKGTTSVLPAITKDDKLEAESAFYTIRSAAAISDVDVHSAIMIDEHGNMLNSFYYEHINNVDS